MNTNTQNRDLSELIACQECDLLMALDRSVEGDHVSCCARCGHPVRRTSANILEWTISLSVTALVLLLVAMSNPFLEFSSAGRARGISLPLAAIEMFRQGFPALALLVFCFVMFVPLVYLLCLLVMALRTKFNLGTSPTIGLGKFVSKLLPWSMAEVFIIGVLVALIKIVALADIILGVSFWAYIMFTVCFLKLSSVIDNHTLWQWAGAIPQNKSSAL